MKYFEYNEQMPRGTFAFPMEFYHVTSRHVRYHMPYHWHMEFELIRVLHGKLHLSMDGVSYLLEQGEAALVADGVLHGAVPEDCLYECLVFNLGAMLNGNASLTGKMEAVLRHKTLIKPHFSTKDKEALWAINRLFEAFRQGAEGKEFAAIGALYLFLSVVLEQKLYDRELELRSRKHRQAAQLRQAFDYIETSYGEMVTLEDLARAAGMTPKYFCRFFREVTNRTPVEYLNHYRVESAAEKLTETNVSVTDVAYACGFNDLSYFIRIFKKYKGITPKQYQKSLAEKEK